ncbi:tripartite motif-containing protein 3-like [Haliotis rufescens]|uniref:tripartite motif-containing protein 3-like n=1 Tax=Haliotis rufescens TaxID=6454 RepID=UPI00201FA382|nr:tripartite motif-containing protein 3-like [Haliotis rufescens]XP_046352400.2 tripartite motif-containing protein 3-like [Haliotis rufescens]XP_046352401.2 tripartite motif-containing protein 3-like [Haliotis rufescens]XP_048248548.1 tripartite motif-containing protein 3-like [Haliotis rufescens]
MATSRAEKVTEFLTCVICQELYTDPCTLRCDHTFCRKCVTGYIQTRPDAVQSKTIPCPCCRQDTKVPHPSRPVEEWAGQIKPSIIIQGLIDTQARPSTEDTGAKCCTLCGQLGERTPAISWCPDCGVTLCERCVKMHRVSPSSRDHELCDLSGDIKVMKRRKVMCQEHKDEQVKYICKDCNRSLCQSCCVVYHRKCESVVTINSQVARMKSELALRSDILRTKCDGKRNKIERHQFQIDKMKDDKVAVKEQVNLIAHKAKEYIRQKEKKLLDELDEITEKHIIQTHADVKLDEIEMQMYRQHCEFIDQALVSDCEMDLYDSYQAWESGAVELVDVRDTDTADTRRIDDIRFTPDTDNVQHILDDLQLGEIDFTYGDGLKCSPVLFHTLDATSVNDKGIPKMLCVTALYVDGMQTVVVTDYTNTCVKSLFTRNKQACQSRLLLDDSPRGLTQLKEKQVMVAVPGSRHIVTVEVTPYLVLLSTIRTRKKYSSLSVLSPSSLAAGSITCVDIMDMAGHVLRSVTTHNNKTLFTFPWYMCVNSKGNILVSDWGKKSVTCVTSDGDVVWRYAPTGDRALRKPTGILTTSTGDIIFIDQFTGTVIQLTETGEYVSDVLTSQDGINQALSLCIDKHDSVLVTGGGEIKTFIFT